LYALVFLGKKNANKAETNFIKWNFWAKKESQAFRKNKHKNQQKAALIYV